MKPSDPALADSNAPCTVRAFRKRTKRAIALIVRDLILSTCLFLGNPSKRGLTRGSSFSTRTSGCGTIVALALPISNACAIVTGTCRARKKTCALAILPNRVTVFDRTALRRIRTQRLGHRTVELSHINRGRATLKLLSRTVIL